VPFVVNARSRVSSKFHPCFIIVFFTATSESRRLTRFLVRRRWPPFLTATSGTPRDVASSVALGGSGRKWYAAKLVCFLIFSFFFFFHLPLLQPSLCTRTLPSLLTDTAAFSLEAFQAPPIRPRRRWQRTTTLTCPHPALSRHSHAPRRRPPRGPSSHTPRRCAPRGCTLTVCSYVFVYLFLTNSLFCNPVTRGDDSHHDRSITRHDAMTRTPCSTATATATTTPHGATIPRSPTAPVTPCAATASPCPLRLHAYRLLVRVLLSFSY
jgi:hypothetical protein